MFFTEMIASGKYIKIKLSLCHNPSLEITVFANSFLSDITNIAKKTNEIIKQIMLIKPIIIVVNVKINAFSINFFLLIVFLLNKNTLKI